MKTKKRLQALIAVAAIMSLICGSLPAVCADEAEAPAETLPGPFQASAEYTYSAPNASSHTANWAWQYYDAAAGNYKDLTTVSGVGKLAVSDPNKYPIGENDSDDGNTFIRFNDGNVARVGKYWMTPDLYARSGDKAPNNYYAVRTFIVPESGNVTITAENGVPEYSGAIRGAMNGTSKNTAVRLIKTDANNTYKTQLWPTVNDSNLVTTIDGYAGTFALVQGKSSTEFPPLTVNVKKGERLRFEVGTKSTASWVNVGVYWDPKITYNSLSFEMPEYQASEAFVQTTVSPTPWIWESYNPYSASTSESEKYTALSTSINTAAFNTFPIPEDGSDGALGFYRTGNANYATVGKYWMTPDKWAASKNDDETYHYHNAVRTFVAPTDGNVTVSAAGMSDADGSKIYGQVKGTGNGGKVRITMEDGDSVTKIWPESDWQVVPRSSSIDFEPVTLNLKKGQRLHFEAADSTTAGSTGYNMAVYWDPKISYNSFRGVDSFSPVDATGLPTDREFALTFKEALTEAVTAGHISITGEGASVKSVAMDNGNKTVKFSFNGLEFGKSYTVTVKDPADKTGLEILYKFTFTTMEGPATYQASDYFDIDQNPYTKDGKSPWQWNYYDLKDKTYHRLTIKNNSSAAGYWCLTGAWGQTVRVNGTMMCGDGRGNDQGGFTADETYTKASQRYYPVRSFTAPASGNIAITANGAVSSTGTGEHPHLRIMIEHDGTFTKVWPKDKEYYEIYSSTQIDNFAASAQDVKAGDILHFEMITTGDNLRTEWDPVVTYIPSLAAVKSEVTFSSGTDFSSVAAALTAGGVTVTVPTTAYYMLSDSVVPVAAVYDASGAMVTCGVGEKQSVKMNQQTNLTVTLPQITGEAPADGYIKVFLWDSDADGLKLMPLGNIGAEPVFGTALIEAEAEKVYFGTGEPGQTVALLVKDEQGKVLYIEQGEADPNGKFRIPLPAVSENTEILCNLNGELTDANCLYASNAGEPTGVGTASSPLSFQKALELAKDGEKIIVMDEIVLPEGFEWPTAQKKVTVSGGGSGAALNIYKLESTILEIHTDTTFKNLEFASTESGNADKVGGIRAFGNVVTLEESVTTRGIFGSFYGGTRYNWNAVDKTETYIYGGNFSVIYGGGGYIKGDCKLTVGGNTNTNGYGDPSDEKNKAFEPYIYGGTLDNTVEGDCITTITGNAAARYLYGGSLDVKTNPDRGAGVKGKTVVNIQGGKFMNVYGMNPPSPKTSGESVSYTADVTINMTGGTVEALIGSSADTLADSVNGSVTINALGGTVTRRIIGGVYNENGWNSNSGKYITGDVNVVIGSGLQGMTDKQTGHGIFGGSRISTNPTAENAKLIFLGGSYDTFKKHINADRIDCNSHHDYLICATAGGTVTPEGGNQITVTPDDEYTAYIGGSVVPAGEYTLVGKQTNIAFTNDGAPPLIPDISALSGTADASGVQATISYTAAADTNTLMLALYENEDLVAIVQPSMQQGIYTNQSISIPYTLKSGTSYTIKAFLWNGMENIVPLCEAKDAEVTAAQ